MRRRGPLGAAIAFAATALLYGGVLPACRAPGGRDAGTPPAAERSRETDGGSSPGPDRPDPAPGTEAAPRIARAPDSADGARGGGPVLLVVGEEEIPKADLADAFLYFFRPQFYEAVGYLVERSLVGQEAQRLGVVLDAEDEEGYVEEELRRQREEIRVQLGPEVTLEAFVEDNFKLDPPRYRALLRGIVRTKHLRDRLIRYTGLTRPSADCRRIVVGDRALAEEIRSKVLEGADFATLARMHSITASGPEGGLLEGVLQGFLDPALDRALFGLEAGGVSAIVPLEVEGETLYHLFLLIRKRPGRDAAYFEVRAEIEEGLRARPPDGLEVLQWNRILEKRYPVVYRMEGTGRE